MLTQYTTFADVRAALGMSAEEIEDAVLELDLYETLLEEDLLAVNSGVLTAWAALPDLNVQSAAESRFYKLVRLYSTYAVAYHLLGSAELFGFLKVADGRASTERTAKAFENLRVDVAAMRTKIETKLLAALLDLVPASVIPAPLELAYVSAVSGATDPVTAA